MANLATNFQDLVAKVKNLVALAPVLGAISHPELSVAINPYQLHLSCIKSLSQFVFFYLSSLLCYSL